MTLVYIRAHTCCCKEYRVVGLKIKNGNIQYPPQPSTRYFFFQPRLRNNPRINIFSLYNTNTIYVLFVITEKYMTLVSLRIKRRQQAIAYSITPFRSLVLRMQCSRQCTEYIHSFQHNLLRSSTLKVRLLFFCFVSLCSFLSVSLHLLAIVSSLTVSLSLNRYSS